MINEKRLKQEAKLLKKNNDSLNQAQALNIVARKYGYSSWLNRPVFARDSIT